MAIVPTMATALLAGAAALATLIPLAGFARVTQAADSIAFLIPAEDGYGIADCMTSKSSCGQGIADAWCVAHGRTRAAAFGAADITGEIPREAGPPPAPGTVVIRCD